MEEVEYETRSCYMMSILTKTGKHYNIKNRFMITKAKKKTQNNKESH